MIGGRAINYWVFKCMCALQFSLKGRAEADKRKKWWAVVLFQWLNEERQVRLLERLGRITGFLRRCLFRLLSHGPMPKHVAFILDGNRRYARKRRLQEGDGHHAGFLTLLSTIKYCYEMGITNVTIYAFSIDNFKRQPHEVRYVMDLMQEKIQSVIREHSAVNDYGVRILFVGNLKRLPEPLRAAIEEAMEVTAGNARAVLTICVAYTSTEELAHAVQGSCEEKWRRRGGKALEEEEEVISLRELEKHFYLGELPEVDILVRTSGETRLSNFLLWQAGFSYLGNPKVLWPEFSLWDLFWAVLQFQRVHPFLEKNRKKSKTMV
ncbi:hypothetical protein ACLOJK_002414 [Asimina triloba]